MNLCERTPSPSIKAVKAELAKLTALFIGRAPSSILDADSAGITVTSPTPDPVVPVADSVCSGICYPMDVDVFTNGSFSPGAGNHINASSNSGSSTSTSAETEDQCNTNN